MPDPVPPTPEVPADAPWWYKELVRWKPTWRPIVAWLVSVVLALLYGWLSGEKPVIPPPPDIFHLAVDSDLTPEQVEELRRRNIEVHSTGWRPPTDEEREATLRVLESPRFADTPAGRAVMGDDGDALVWRLAIRAKGEFKDKNQGQIGSCVGNGAATATETTMRAQVANGKVRQDLPDICVEAIYAGSRVEVNGGRVPFNGDGSTGSWAAKWLETVGGALPYGKHGSHDLTGYDVGRCKQWGDRGVPDDLETIAKKHKAKCTLVASATEAKKALRQGYAIFVCSNQGFSNTRDKDGFLKPQGTWSHCMAIIGYRDDKPGFLIENSWGSDWVKGPKGKFDDIPDGSFWAEERVVDRMLRGQDSFAVANAEGFVKRKIDWNDWVVQRERPRRVIEPLFALSP